MKRKLCISAISVIIALLVFGVSHLINLRTFRHLTTVTNGNRIMGGTEAVDSLLIEHMDSGRTVRLLDADSVSQTLSFFNTLAYGGVDDYDAWIRADLNTYSIRLFAADDYCLISNLYISSHPAQTFIQEDGKLKRYLVKNTVDFMEHLDQLFSS